MVCRGVTLMIGWQDKADKFDEDEWNQRWKDGVEEENERALTDGGIEEANRGLLRRYRDFRRAADAVTTAWRECRQVVAVSLIGSVAREPWKEVPRFAPYRRARIELWHECTDVDLALWLSDTGNLNEFRRVRARTLRALVDENCHGVATHHVDVFILEPGTNRYLGRLCDYNACPRGKPECGTPGCGTVKFLRRHEEFQWWPETLAEGRSVRLFDRATQSHRLAADLPLPGDRGYDAPSQ